MGVKVEGMIGAEDMVLNLDTTARRRVRRALVAKAVELQKLAIKMAPVDESNLEQAIKLRGDGAQARDGGGRFVRTEVEVYIDMAMPVPQRPGKVVGDYAYEIHEHLAPMGLLKLGPASRAKQAANGGIEVGGGFLTRAAEAVDKSIDAALEELLAGLW